MQVCGVNFPFMAVRSSMIPEQIVSNITQNPIQASSQSVNNESPDLYECQSG